MEYLDIYDEFGKYIGKELRDVVHEKALWHKTVHCWLYDKAGNVFFQIRKDRGTLYTTASGHLQAGETIADGFHREIKEELGIDIEENELIYTGMQKGNTAFINSFIVKKDIDLSEITLQKEEVSKAEWDSYEEVEEKYNNAEFVPHWWEYIKNDIKKYFN